MPSEDFSNWTKSDDIAQLLVNWVKGQFLHWCMFIYIQKKRFMLWNCVQFVTNLSNRLAACCFCHACPADLCRVISLHHDLQILLPDLSADLSLVSALRRVKTPPLCAMVSHNGSRFRSIYIDIQAGKSQHRWYLRQIS
jgi:hypothetical protein